MGSEWIAGAFGLAGVIVGGSITTMTGIIGERRRERAEARVGAQLLRRELQTAARSASQGIRNLTWGPTRSLTTDAWDEYQQVLAISLTPEDWIAVAAVVENIRRVTLPMIDVLTPAWRAEVVPLPDGFVKELQHVYEDCRKAFGILHKLSQAPSEYRDFGGLDSQDASPPVP
jgi:hypothetical protein